MSSFILYEMLFLFLKKLSSFFLSLFHVLFILQGDAHEEETHSSLPNNANLSKKVGVEKGPVARCSWHQDSTFARAALSSPPPCPAHPFL